MTARTLIVSIAAAAALTLTVQAQVKPTAESQLQAAINQELLNGDLPAAIKSYEAIVATYGKTNRPVAAQALERIANAHDRLVDGQGRDVRLRIVRDFADQRDVAAHAQAWLTAAGSSAQASTAPRLVWGEAAGLSQGGISADGIAAIVGGGGRIGLRNLTTRETKWLDVRLDPNDDEGGTPVLSPDGSAVVYTKGPTSLGVVGTAAGSRSRVLVSNPDFGTIVPHAWSPDRKLILVSTVRKDGTWQISWVSAADGSMKTLRSLDWRFTYDFGVSLSPDGRFVAYPALPENPAVRTLNVIRRSETHIYVVPADGTGREVEVVRTAGQNLYPAWTPDGKHLLFVSRLGPASSVWAVPMSGATPAGPAVVVRDRVDSLVSGSGVTRAGAFQFLTVVPPPSVVSVVSRTPGNPTHVPGTFNGSNAVFSPDGTSVAVSRGAYLVIHTLASGDERSFAVKDTLGEGLASIVWLPDGRSLLTSVAVADPVSNGRVIAWRQLDLATGQFTEVLPGGANGDTGAISPDGRTFYFPTAMQTTDGAVSIAIVAFDLTTHSRRVVVSLPPIGVGRLGPTGALFLEKLSGDGRVLAFSRGVGATGGTHYWRVGVDGSDPREFLDNTGKEILKVLGLDRDGRSLLCARWALAGQPMPLQRISTDTGAIETLEPNILSTWKAPSDVPQYPRVSLSQDGTQMAVVGWGKAQRELWAIDNVASLVQRK